MEKFFYELKPYLCIAVAIYALLTPEPSRFVIGCSIILLAVGSWILKMRLKARTKKGKGIEHFFYETQPYFYILLGGYAFITHRSSKIALICSVILFVCGAIILKWRADYRSK